MFNLNQLMANNLRIKNQLLDQMGSNSVKFKRTIRLCKTATTLRTMRDNSGILDNLYVWGCTDKDALAYTHDSMYALRTYRIHANV